MSELERWEARFAAPGYHFGTAPNAFLKSKADLLKPGQKALSIADGEGRNGVFLAEQGLDVLAMDFSPTALAKARTLARSAASLRTEQADLDTWTWPVEGSTSWSRSSFSSVRRRCGRGVRQHQAGAKPGGLLLMEGYRPEQLEYKTGGPSEVENLYTASMLEESSPISPRSRSRIRQRNPRRPGHGGMSALIDLVGRK